MKKQTIITLTAIAAILAAALFAGCIEEEASVSTPISNSDFRNLSADMFDALGDQLEKVDLALDNGDFVTAKIELAAFESLLEQDIADFKQMEVTENMLPLKKAQISICEEFRLASVYLNAYLENPTVDTYAAYIEQHNIAMAQMAIAGTLVENI